jgi:toxin ParE1/3/4
MLEIVKRPRAKKDLKGIWLYTFNEWGEAQADKYLSQIETGLARLKYNPKLGRPREDLRAGYRSLRVNEHIIYYVVTPSSIRVIRVLHAQMDPERHL